MSSMNMRLGQMFSILHKGDCVGMIAPEGTENVSRTISRRLSERGLVVEQKEASITIYLQINKENLVEEQFCLMSKLEQGKKHIYIRGNSQAALFFGAGEFLRRLRYSFDGSISIPDLDMKDAPRMPWRGVMTCYHKQDNGYKYWDVAREREFMEEMALWGSSFAMFSPLNMWQRNSKTLVDGTPENQAWNTMASMPAEANELGLKYGLLNVPNDVFEDDLQSCRQSKAGPGQMLFAECACACPSDPKAWELILQRRKEFFAKLERVDFLYIHPSDYGGCSCDECGPYIPTYLRLAKEVAGVMRQFHPRAKVYIGTVLITEQGVRQYVLPFLNSSDSDWLDGIVYGMHGTAVSLSEFCSAIPQNRFEIILYPEITMVENWGRIGAAPWVKHFAYSLERTQDMGSECNRVGTWPNTSERMFGESFPISFDPEKMSGLISGAFVYSEGLHDDVSKIIWLRYCWNPDRSREEVLMDYCRYYFGEEAAEFAWKAIMMMEDISYQRDHKLFSPPLTFNDDGTGLEKAQKVFDTLQKMKDCMPDWAAESWRYQFLELRSRIDLAAFRNRDGELSGAEKTDILDLAETIYQKTFHVNILPAGSPWNRDKAATVLESLLSAPEKIEIVAPVSPIVDL